MERTNKNNGVTIINSTKNQYPKTDVGYTHVVYIKINKFLIVL